MKHLAFALALLAASSAHAADHGPVFSYSTPVNSEREFSFDTGIFGRSGSAGTQLSTGSSLGYGITPHITVNAFLPVSFGSGSLPESRILSGSEWAATGSWRFLHSVTSVGKRIESTATAGIVLPGPQSDSGIFRNLHRAPGLTTSLATGFASRSSYLWLGGGYSRFLTGTSHRISDRRPDTLSWSAVYGYRPARLRRGYDQWDYRGFAEFTGEHTGNVVLSSHNIPKSQTTSLWLGPSILAIYRNIAIEGGIQAPLYREASEQLYGREHLRFALNFSYLKYSAHTSAH